MATRRRSRRKSISGNLTDIQKRIRYLETRPAASRLASKAVSTRNLALRAVDEEVVADNAIVRRSIANNAVGTAQIEQESITKILLATNSVGTAQIEQDSVTANEIAPGTITSTEMGPDSVTSTQIQNGSVGTDELAGGIPDSKISGMSASKLIGSVTDSQITSIAASKVTGQIGDSQISGITGSKIIGGIDGGLIVAGSVTEGKIASLPTSKLTGTISNDQLAGSIQAIKIAGVSSSVLIGEISASIIPNLAAGKITSGTFSTAQIPSITNSMLAGGITNGKIASVNADTIITGTIGFNRLPAGSGSNQVAIGNHTHAAGSVGAHTHNAGLSMTSLNISGGAHGHTGQNGSHSHGITPTGTVTVGGVIQSTLKSKQDISNFTIQDPKNILNLKMKRYKYKNSVRGIQNRYNREWMYGYIAEEVQDIGVEQILAYDKNGDPDGIDYGLLSVLVLELVKVQQTEIDSLKEEIQRLKEVI